MLERNRFKGDIVLKCMERPHQGKHGDNEICVLGGEFNMTFEGIDEALHS